MRYAIGLLLLVSCSGTFASQPERRALTFEDRVRAQKAIEQVYWNHRIWPKENPGPKPPLPTVMSDNAIRNKVTDYLNKSSALDRWWQRPITAVQLQAEMDRMASDTRDATVLRELFDAVGNDPFVIAETLARQTLADRLIRNWYAYDTRFHSAVRERAEHALIHARNAAELKTLGGEYREMTWVQTRDTAGLADRNNNEVNIDAAEWTGKLAELKGRFDGRYAADVLPVDTLSSLKETAEDFSVVMVLESATGRIRVASVAWPKIGFDAWWASKAPALAADSTDAIAAPESGYVSPAIVDSACTPDTWQPTNDVEMPASRSGHTAVWTGTEMIVWGGGGNTGARYDPSTDTWTATGVDANSPSPRYGHTAVWTGTEMIVWGGAGVDSTGGRYNPSSDTWTATATAGAPGGRRFHTAVWTGTQMIVWGGAYDQEGAYTVFNDGGRYTPSSDAWTATSTGTNVPSARYGHTAIWTGGVMVIWGGQGANSAGSAVNTGGRYTPGSNSWIVTGTGMNLPSARSGHTAVWRAGGAEMIVWGGTDASGAPVNTGGRYNVSSDQWITTGIGANAPSARFGHTAVYNASGTEMIVWGGQGISGALLNSGGRFNLSNNQWKPATSTGANVPSARSGHTAVWTGAEMIVWGGTAGDVVNTGGRYNPSTDSWVPTASKFAPLEREHDTTVWTGAEMIVWGGDHGSSFYLNAGGRYNPSTDSWTATSTGANVPSARDYPTAVWTGTEMIVWGGAHGGVSYLNTGGRYNPATDGWISTSTGANLPSARQHHTAVWTGTEMIVWGGTNIDNSGGRYNPSTDSWTATSTGANAPARRYLHSAVWTGTEMIVWGGVTGSGYSNTGGRYSPATDSWSATSTGTNTPSARAEHTAVWTGTEMIVWGTSGNGTYETGGRYNPLTDAWTPTSTGVNVPSGRYGHSAVWTGTEMIVWGGTYDFPPFNDGGRYSPSTDTWTATSTGINVPSPRYAHSAVWTGREMIVWGGDTFYPVTPGGRYCVDICGSSVTCTDGNTCTTDTCDPTSGCVYTSSPGPPEIQSIAVAADKATFSWPAAQDTTQYDVVRGSTGAFPVGPSGDDEVCFDNLVGATVTDPTVPNAGEGFWYLSRGENSCGIGTFGTQSDGTPRMTTTCP